MLLRLTALFRTVPASALHITLAAHFLLLRMIHFHLGVALHLRVSPRLLIHRMLTVVLGSVAGVHLAVVALHVLFVGVKVFSFGAVSAGIFLAVFRIYSFARAFTLSTGHTLSFFASPFTFSAGHALSFLAWAFTFSSGHALSFFTWAFPFSTTYTLSFAASPFSFSTSHALSLGLIE